MDCQILLIYSTLQVLSNLYYRKHQCKLFREDFVSSIASLYCPDPACTALHAGGRVSSVKQAYFEGQHVVASWFVGHVRH